MRVLTAVLAIIVFLSVVGVIAYYTMPTDAEAQFVEALANASKKAEKNKYFGEVTEIDKGEGAFALEGDGYKISAPSHWAGMIAEFKRRHPDLEVVSHSIIFNAHGPWANGVVIITVPKNRCLQ